MCVTNRKMFLLTILLCLTGKVFAATPIRYSVSTSLSMPYAMFEGEQLVGGIMFDLSKAIEKQLQTPVVYVVLPRKRIDAAVLQGDIDLRCYISPAFVDNPEQYAWSPGLFEISDVLFGTAGSVFPRSLDAIPAGSAVSTVIGYVYPALDSLFATGRLKRDDTVGQENVHLKMAAGRTPYGVGDSIALNWYEKETGFHGLSSWRLVISRRDFQCAIPKNGTADTGRLMKAFEALKKANQFEEILRRYR